MKKGATNLVPLKWLPSMKWLWALFRQWRLVVAALITGAIVHILVTLSTAQFGEASSYRALTRGLSVNQASFGAPVTDKAQPLPFFAPDALYSFCRYDASSTRIRVSAKLPDAGWSLSLHTPKGENFYYVPGIEARQTDIELVLVPPGNVFAQDAVEVTKAEQSIPLIKLPNAKGLVILRAPIKGFAYRRRVDELRAAFACRPQNAVTARR